MDTCTTIEILNSAILAHNATIQPITDTLITVQLPSGTLTEWAWNASVDLWCLLKGASS